MSPAEQLLAQAVEFHKVNDLARAVPIYNQLLTMEPFNPGVLYLLGDAAVRQDCHGLAINLLSNAISLKPTMESYTALGCAYKFAGHNEEALIAWKAGLAIQETPELLSNVASIYADSGRPAEAMKLIDKALAMKPDDPCALWNRSLANLTAQNWVQGWSDHEYRFHPAIQNNSKKRDFNCPDWDGTPGVRVAVHGEQGVGDEIMFLSMLHELQALCPDIVVEVEPRLMDVVELNFGVPAYGTEAAMKAHEKPFDYQIALGSLGRFFRKHNDDFTGAPYLHAEQARVNYWRRKYAEMGPPPYVGVAWQGGSKSTRIKERTINASELSFATRGTAISLQYGENVEETAKANGFRYFPESNGSNMMEQLAMTAACDLVVTVPQTLVHVAGSLGVPCYVLTPKYPSWRYGIADNMPWYGSVRLLRQLQEGVWAHPIAEAKKAVDQAWRLSHAQPNQ